jgi:hypothetical protein
MAHSVAPVSAADRLATLAVRQHLSLGILHSARPHDFALVLAAASMSFVAGRSYTEREVNSVLRDWLADTGPMLAVDHVTLRRVLVDSRVLERDGFGHAYALAPATPEMAQLIRELSALDLAATVRDARAQAHAARQARKRNWEQQQRAPGA